MSQDGLAGGTEQQTGKSAAATTADHDQLCRVFPGGGGVAKQVRCRAAAEDLRPDGNLRVFPAPPGEFDVQ